MLDRLRAFEKKYEELSMRICDPAVAASSEKYTAVARELREVEPVALKYREYLDVISELDGAGEMLETEKDPELREMIADEINELKSRRTDLENEIRVLMLPKDPDDEKNVVIEIRGGAGGEEAALFAAVLYRMYTMYAAKKGWTSEIAGISETGLGGIKEVSFILSGTGVYSRLRYESGVHRVQRVPETETQGRIHTSTVTVAVLPEAEEVELTIDPAQLRIDTFRSSGAGGQHINKTESAIRITHLPTGLVVECQDERSQYKNKDKAMKVLRSRLLESEREKQAKEVSDERRSQVGTGDRSERIRTYNYPQGRVTDHRIGLTLYQLENVLDGDLDVIIDALAAADRAARLEKQGSEV